MVQRCALRPVHGLYSAIVVGLFCVCMRSSGVPRQTSHLPDGATLTLAGATVSTPHRFSGDDSLHSLFRLVSAPGGGESWSGAAEVVPTRPAAEVLWFELAAPPQHELLDPTGRLRVQICDEHNCTTELTDQTTFQRLSADRGFMSVALARFPRRARHLRLGVFDWSRGFPERPVTFEIPNPQRIEERGWVPAPLPQTRTEADVECSLIHFSTGVLSRHSSGFSASGTVETEADFHVAERDGHPCPEWRPIAMQAVDRGGNVFPDDDGTTLVDPHPGRTRLHFAEELFTEEPGWKLHVELARAVVPGLPQGAVCTFRDVPVPPPGRSPDSGLRTAEAAGRRLSLPGLRWERGGLTAHVRVAGVEPGRTLFLTRVVDDHGSPLRTPTFLRWTRNRRAAYTDYTIPLDVTGHEKTLSLELAVQETRLVEFVANPERPFPQ